MPLIIGTEILNTIDWFQASKKYRYRIRQIVRKCWEHKLLKLVGNPQIYLIVTMALTNMSHLLRGTKALSYWACLLARLPWFDPYNNAGWNIRTVTFLAVWVYALFYYHIPPYTLIFSSELRCSFQYVLPLQRKTKPHIITKLQQTYWHSVPSVAASQWVFPAIVSLMWWTFISRCAVVPCCSLAFAC
jgi:hypothetical protein